MPRQTTVIEFEDREIRDLLTEKAKEALGKPTNSGVQVELFCGTADAAPQKTDKIRVLVTFSGKVDR